MRYGKTAKRILIGALALLLAAALPAASFAAPAAWPSDVSVSAEGACVMDANSKTILFGKNEDTAYYPASITKVMTALLTIENCSDLSETVTFSRAAVNDLEDNATVIGASAGDRLSVRDCLYSLLFKSANEVANALAEHVGAKFPEKKKDGMSDRDVFVSMMNEKAAALGCTNTHFDNPSGLTDENHYTTAHDMCLILAAAIENETFLEIESRTYWTHEPIKRYPDPEDPWNTVYQSHRMLRKNSYYYYPGVFAGKTGFTTTAGNTLVTACKKDGMTLVVTVLNGHMTHYEDTKALLNFAYRNFHALKVADYDTSGTALLSDLSVLGLPVTDIAALSVDADSVITLPKEEGFESAEASLSLTLSDQDPEGAAAKMLYRYGERTVGTAYLRSRLVGQTEKIEAVQDDPLYQRLAESSAPEQLAGSSPDEASEEALDGRAEEREETEAAGAEAASAAGTRDAAQTETPQQEGGRDAAGRFFVPPAVQTGFKIAAAVLGAAILGAVLLFRAEKREAQRRARRRAQRLKHTRDLTGQQNIKLDLMVQQSLQKKKRKRSRRR